MNLQLVVLLAYAAVFTGVGLVVSRRVKRADDFLVAGRSLSPGLIAATFLAANIGAGSTVNASALGYVYGISAWWWVGSAGLGSLILANTVGPKIWTLAAEHGWRTVGDFLDARFNRSVRGLIAVLLWAATLMILAGQLIAMSAIFDVVAGMSKWEGCVLGGAIVTAYFAAGGLLSSAWVNLIQLVVKLTGFIVAIPFAIAAAGGWGAIQPALRQATPLGATGTLSWIVILVPSFIISPGLVQKLYGARDARAARIGVNWNAIGLLLFAFAPPILGAVAHTRFPNLANHDQALPVVYTKLMPPWIGLLTLAALFSAEVSASDAVLFMLSSSLSIDLYKRFVRPDASDRRILAVGRVAAVVGAACGVVFAVALPSIISALTIFYTIMTVALAAPFLVGLYSRRPTAAHAIAAIVVSVVVTALTRSAIVGIVPGFLIMLVGAARSVERGTPKGNAG